MKLRPLVIDDITKARVTEVEAFARANWYRPGQSENVPGDDPRHTSWLDIYRCVFSYTVAPDGELWRHLSISVPSKDYPHPVAVYAIAELFGFTGWDGESLKPPQDRIFNLNKEDHCVVVAQQIPQ